MTCACLKKFEGTGKLFIALILSAILLVISLLLFVGCYLRLPPKAQQAMQACFSTMPYSHRQSTQNDLSSDLAIDKKIQALEKQISSLQEEVTSLCSQVKALKEQLEVLSFWQILCLVFCPILGAIISFVFACFFAIFFSTFAKKIANRVTKNIQRKEENGKVNKNKKAKSNKA